MRVFFIACVAIFCIQLNAFSQLVIGDKIYQEQVSKDFDARCKQLPARLGPIQKKLQNDKSEKAYALKYLYAYMPLSDIGDYSDAFFEGQVIASFNALSQMPWSKQLSPELLRHYVLPIRVNTENLDTARQYCFSHLKDRVKSMSMTDAALEVNHWCHEKVVYKSTDGRTSAPLATIRTAYGRCGEESTLLVAALRAVGIPARQVYTPRWAHSDDNHAWVEMWVDGAWHYTGACEPEAVLDKGWFTGPAKRAMMMHTKVFGRYEGKDEVLESGFGHSRINILSNYAETHVVSIQVVDGMGAPVANAQVDFGLYNYAEFYPLATRITNANGLCSLKTGKGDLMIWVSSNQGWAQVKLDTRQSNELKVTVSQKTHQGLESFEMVPPAELPVSDKGTKEENQRNQVRLSAEDSIRSVYVDAFPTQQLVSNRANQLKVNADSLWRIISRAAGNSDVLFAVLEKHKLHGAIALRLFFSLSEKDLRDANFAVLDEAVQAASQNPQFNGFLIDYVFNPRINLEQLKPFRGLLTKSISKGLQDSCRKNPAYVFQRFRHYAQFDSTQNYYGVLLSPAAVAALKACDLKSFQVFGVALLRTMQIPARIETARLMPQAWVGDKWVDLQPDVSGKESKIKLIVDLAGSDSMYTPAYGIHFSLARLEKGRFKTLDYEGDPVFSKFPASLELPQGTYRLLSSIRSSNGSVKGSLDYFDLNEKTAGLKKEVRLFQLTETSKILGKVRLDQFPTSVSKQIAAQGLILIWIDPVKEPSRHVLAEMQDLRRRFEDWGAKVLILFDDKSSKSKMDTRKYPDLPANCVYQVDEQLELQKQVLAALGKTATEAYPLMVFMNEQGELSAYSSGYAIGNVERISKTALNELYCKKPLLKP
ncbi:MAG: transglutaminase-like domain-containing protein [Bacteroidetes bacterium]|nr:transglutaminase-like domain-containing protein [Bacteroidota bacterium]